MPSISRRLQRAVLAAAAVQRDEAARKAFALQVAQLALGRSKACASTLSTATP